MRLACLSQGRLPCRLAGALRSLDLQSAVSFWLIGGPDDLGCRASGFRSGYNLGVRLRADRLEAVSLSQHLSRPVVQFDTLAQ